MIVLKIMKTNTKKGFTLIELLVVIAIIGILSSVVLASLNSARNKGADAAVKGNLNGIRTQAELYYDNNSSSYGTLAFASASASCATQASGNLFADPTIKSAIVAAVASGNGNASCVASSTGWAVSVPLKTTGSWCVDSNGRATTSVATATGC
jgi:type IV pilus assembly protein PilA